MNRHLTDSAGRFPPADLPAAPDLSPYHGGPFGAHVHRSLGSLAGEPDAAENKVTQ